jgi:hypothetical protein
MTRSVQVGFVDNVALVQVYLSKSLGMSLSKHSSVLQYSLILYLRDSQRVHYKIYFHKDSLIPSQKYQCNIQTVSVPRHLGNQLPYFTVLASYYKP